ncbi:MAG: hypothetical protein IK104_07480 [Clostridia bacterium]|nr:hypothetical protein [Clostridia bacterium]
MRPSKQPKIIAPNPDGTYTIPAGEGYTMVTIVGASQSDSEGSPADETPGASAGKTSFWDALAAFFQKIASFFSNLFR